MSKFYIADLHLNHANVIKFDKRPFETVEEMNEKLIANWNQTVKSDDEVFILGDLIWDKESLWDGWLERLTGVKYLIKGNHDPHVLSAATRKHFADVTSYKEIVDEGRHVILCHYPIPFYKKAYDPNYWMLYGHVHVTREEYFLEQLRNEVNKSRTEPGHAFGHFVNVGCMMPWMDYTPRTLDEIIDWYVSEMTSKD